MGKRYKDREAIIADFSERLRKERKRLKLTQQGLADEIGVDVKTIGNWEKQNTLPKKLDDALALCDLFECDIDYLFGRQKEKTKEVTDICEATGLKAEAVKILIKKKERLNISNFLSHFIMHDHFEEIVRGTYAERGLVGFINLLKKKGLYGRLKEVYEYTKASVGTVGVTPSDTEDARLFEYLQIFRDELYRNISEEERLWLGLYPLRVEDEWKKTRDNAIKTLWKDLDDESNIQRDYWVISNLFLDVIKSYLQIIAFTEEEVIEIFAER